MMMRKNLFLLSVALLVIFLSIGFFELLNDLPDPNDLKYYSIPPSIRITDRYDRILYEVIGDESGRHTSVSIDSIPLNLRQATVATEDTSYYENPGVDFRGILRAVWINIKGGETLAGGSTITQQVARNLLLGSEERSERTLRRKIRESILAWEISRNFTKDEILSLYLNNIYYGSLSYGVEAASQTYFGKPVTELDLAECALIAGLPQAPAIYNPFTNAEAALKRQHVVLDLMEKAGYITAEQHYQADNEPLVFTETPYPMEAPHFVMMVRSELDRIFTLGKLKSGFPKGGLVVKTTLDLDWQHHAERIILDQIHKLHQSEEGLGHNVNNAAFVALDPKIGDILALVGSPDYFDQSNAGAINMVITPRQPGSAIKPVVYAAAMDPNQAESWTPATMILDVKTSFTTLDGKAYIPANYDGQEHGPVTLREALASSLNIPAVITLNHVGIEKFAGLADKMGIKSLSNPKTYDLSLALGGGAVSLLDLSSAYSAFANGGYRVEPRFILKITSQNGIPVYEVSPPTKIRVLDERVAWLISDILGDDSARMLGFGRNSVLRLDRWAAVKTGTTTNFHDNWTVGYTPEVVVGVWAGNTDYRPMRHVTGVTGAAPIWHQFMRIILSGKPESEFKQPDGITKVEVCISSGLLPNENCPYKRWEWFITGTQPTQPDRTTQPAERSAVLAIKSPSQNSTYKISTFKPADSQKIRIQASGDQSLSSLTLWLDGKPLNPSSTAPFEAWWTLQPGNHLVWATATTSTGNEVTSAIVEFTVSKDE